MDEQQITVDGQRLAYLRSEGGGRAVIFVHGNDGEQLVNLAYLKTLAVPTLWRGAVQLIPDAGHAPQEETPEAFAALLEAFITDLT